MELTTFQPWERRDAQDEIIRPGTYGKNTALVNGQNTGILDYIGNNLDVLYKMASGAAALTWQPVTNYTADTMIFVGKGLVAVCTQAGRSGTTAPEWQEGEVEDGTVLWQVTNFVEALGDIYTHISTTALHVNSALKEKWNNHVDDDDIHVTEEEKNAWNGHLEDTDNPHGVTKEQVGLGNVDNTSDLDKPISDAAQSALDGKLTISQGTSNAGKLLIVNKNGNIEPRNTSVVDGSYVGMRIEGGGTIFFDYMLGYKYGSLSVAPITTGLHSYHIDSERNIVICDDPGDTTKKHRFYVVSDYDIGEYMHGTCLQWASTDLTTMYNVNLGTSTAFGQGYNNTQKCITAASNGGALEWNALAYKNIWHYIWKGDWQARNPKWFVPSKDELNVLLNMQWQEAARRKSYDETITFPQLPINFYSYYWSSSESSATVAHIAGFCYGTMGTDNKNNADLRRVRLVKTF